MTNSFLDVLCSTVGAAAPSIEHLAETRSGLPRVQRPHTGVYALFGETDCIY